MAKILVSDFVSLDGVMEGPGDIDPFELRGWSMPYMTPRIGHMKFDELKNSGGMILGRKTYEGFASFWPNAPEDESGFTSLMNNIPKYVVSTTLNKVDWNNSILINNNVFNSISELKKKISNDLLITGSADLINSLIPQGLIDEFRLWISPVVVGKGKHLFQEGTNLKLKLIEAKFFDSGSVLLDYQYIA
jgi:dihydrofolate reductase